MLVLVATIKAIVMLPDACISHEPRIEPELIRLQPKTRAPPEHENQERPHFGHDKQKQQVWSEKDAGLREVVKAK